ncbi:MAG: ferritin family protein [Candidatus Eremiobacterota bacterium]
MNIFEYALEKEKQSRQYYKDLAEKCGNEGLNYILNMLAEEEDRHIIIIQNMQDKHPEMLPPSNLLENARKTFAKMKDSKSTFDFNVSQVELYKKAREMEKIALEYYAGQINELKDEIQKKIFQKLSDEEQRHYDLLGNIIEFITRPQSWLENAEFHHVDEY